MGLTAQQIIANEIIKYLEAESESCVMNTQDLEDRTRVKEWGKWALIGESSGQGIKRQIKFKARNPEDTTLWEAIPLMSDDDAMRVESAISKLGKLDRDILCHIYVYWNPTRMAAKSLGINRDSLYDRRDMALAYICGILEKNA